MGWPWVRVRMWSKMSCSRTASKSPSLASEIGVDHPLVGGGRRGDAGGATTCETEGGEFGGRGVQDAAPGRRRVPGGDVYTEIRAG
jgi:hypothetical protein